MAMSESYKVKRDLIAKWLLDLLETTDDPPYAKYRPHAADLIKFLTAHGVDLRLPEHIDGCFYWHNIDNLDPENCPACAALMAHREHNHAQR